MDLKKLSDIEFRDLKARLSDETIRRERRDYIISKFYREAMDSDKLLEAYKKVLDILIIEMRARERLANDEIIEIRDDIIRDLGESLYDYNLITI